MLGIKRDRRQSANAAVCVVYAMTGVLGWTLPGLEWLGGRGLTGVLEGFLLTLCMWDCEARRRTVGGEALRFSMHVACTVAC